MSPSIEFAPLFGRKRAGDTLSLRSTLPVSISLYIVPSVGLTGRNLFESLNVNIGLAAVPF